tara:strand:+ start:815 stop:1543 length:729 start_codon:yes stop_codon:yes gene_type:complete
MATDIAAFVQFSDGTFASLLKEGATAEAVTSLPTGGNGLNQVSGIEIGQAYAGKTAICAAVRVATDSAQTGSFCYAYFLGPDGKIMVPVQGGGFRATGLPKLKKPVRMSPGVTLQAAFDATADAVALASLAVYCADGTSDCFFVKAVADTKTAMVNKDGSSIGQALTGKVISCTYATYSATNGLNDDGGGVGAFYLESSDGQLKSMYPPTNGGIGEVIVPYMSDLKPVRIMQNDTLSVMAGV